LTTTLWLKSGAEEPAKQCLQHSIWPGWRGSTRLSPLCSRIVLPSNQAPHPSHACKRIAEVDSLRRVRWIECSLGNLLRLGRPSLRRERGNEWISDWRGDRCHVGSTALCC
jgi:hypothetical protein